MTLKISLKNHLILLRFFIGTSIFCFILYMLLEKENLVLLGLLGFQLIASGPGLYMHYVYYRYNRGQTIELNDESLVIIENQNSTSYKCRDFTKLVLHKTINLDTGTPKWAVDYYQYIKMYPNTGEPIIITCLMTPNMKKLLKALDKIPFEKEIDIAGLPWK